MPLSPQLQSDVKGQLERLYGPGLDLSFAPNPTLLGGLCIRVGSDVYDGSVQARLAALEQRTAAVSPLWLIGGGVLLGLLARRRNPSR